MEIKHIYIAAHRYDLRKTNICVASIKFWYPGIPIYLIKDLKNGRFDTKYLEKLHVYTYKNGVGKWGWGFGKLLPLFENSKDAFLVVDSDTVFYGEVLEKVKRIDADFIVNKEIQTDFQGPGVYYDPECVRKFIPDFQFPGYTFNTGQWFGSGGVLKREDFNLWLSWHPVPHVLYKDITAVNGDQGILNLVVHLKEKAGEIKVEKIPLMFWAGAKNNMTLDIEKISRKSIEEPTIIHWAGIKKNRLREYPYAEVLKFYEDYFFSLYGIKERFLLKLKYAFFGFEEKLKFYLRRFKSLYKQSA